MLVFINSLLLGREKETPHPFKAEMWWERVVVMCLHSPQSGQNSHWLFQLKSVAADVMGGHLHWGLHRKARHGNQSQSKQ